MPHDKKTWFKFNLNFKLLNYIIFQSEKYVMVFASSVIYFMGIAYICKYKLVSLSNKIINRDGKPMFPKHTLSLDERHDYMDTQ